MNETNDKFAVYDFNYFPKVLVKLNKTIKDENDYNTFTTNWLNAYNMKQYFYMIIDSSNTGLVNIYYAIKISSFIKDLKRNAIQKFGKQWLQYSIIYVKSDFIMKLLNLIFYISGPVAPVFIISNYEDSEIIESICNNYKTSNNKLKNIYFGTIKSKLLEKKINFKLILP